jgi:hypothetical protein
MERLLDHGFAVFIGKFSEDLEVFTLEEKLAFYYLLQL